MLGPRREIAMQCVPARPMPPHRSRAVQKARPSAVHPSHKPMPIEQAAPATEGKSPAAPTPGRIPQWEERNRDEQARRSADGPGILLRRIIGPAFELDLFAHLGRWRRLWRRERRPEIGRVDRLNAGHSFMSSSSPCLLTSAHIQATPLQNAPICPSPARSASIRPAPRPVSCTFPIWPDGEAFADRTASRTESQGPIRNIRAARPGPAR